MTKKPYSLTATIAALTLFSVALAGCTEGEGIYDRQDFALENHALILHPPYTQWDQENQTIGGNFTFSNISEVNNISAPNIVLFIRFYNEGSYTEQGYTYFDRLHNQYAPGGLIIPTQKTIVFNYTHRVAFDGGGPLEEVVYSIHYDYNLLGDVWKRDDNSKGYSSTIVVAYYNRCLVILDEHLAQNVDNPICAPWIDDKNGEPKTHYYTFINGEKRIPPPEYWPDWSDDSPIPLSRYPGLRPGVEFLRDFDYTTANVTYYEGRIR